jgi:hypothetical protein
MLKPTLTQTQTEIVVRLLGQQDAVHWPIREIDSSWSARWEQRWSYHRVGMPWRPGERSSAAKKRAEIDLGALCKAGLVARTKGKSRTITVQLTSEGDRYGRLAADLTTLAVSTGLLKALVQISEQRRAEDSHLFGEWVPEIELTGQKGWGDGHGAHLGGLHEDLLPCYTHAYVETNCDRDSHVFLRPTELGRIVAAGDGPVDDDCGLVEVEADREDFFDLYDAEMFQTLEGLKMATPQDPSAIGAVPLPASMAALPKLSLARTKEASPA